MLKIQNFNLYPLTKLNVSLLQVVLKQYDEVKMADQGKQQEYLDKNKARLITSYDKSFWEIKPAAKVTGKKQPPVQDSMSFSSYHLSCTVRSARILPFPRYHRGQ